MTNDECIKNDRDKFLRANDPRDKLSLFFVILICTAVAVFTFVALRHFDDKQRNADCRNGDAYACSHK